MRWRSAVVGFDGFGAIVSVAREIACGDAVGCGELPKAFGAVAVGCA